MLAKCAQAVMQAAGRQLSETELRDIEDSIGYYMRHPPQALLDQWAGMPLDQRMKEAAAAAAQAVLAQRSKAAQRDLLKIVSAARNDEQIARIRPKVRSFAAAVVRRLEEADVYAKGMTQDYFSRLMDTIEAAEPRWFGLVEDAAATADFAREVFRGADGSTGNTVAQKGAKAWLETVEAMRVRFNRAGGDIGKLAYGYLPQMHDAQRVLKAGQDAWVNGILPLLDRRRYLNADGSHMSEASLREVMDGAYRTIADEGRNKIVPGQQQGSGMRANRGSESRVIHFADADAYLKYMADFGRGGTFGALQGHVRNLAREIALVEEFGPNAELEFRRLDDKAYAADGGRKRVFAGITRVSPEQVWKTLSGYTEQAFDPKLADVMGHVRNYTVATKLQGNILSSFSDVGTLALTARLNKMPELETFGTVMRQFGGDAQDAANRVGLVADSVVGRMTLWAESNVGHQWSGRLANATQKLGLMQAWTDALRQGFAVQMSAAYGKLIGKDWASLSKFDRYTMERRGFTQQDWTLLQRATPEEVRGMPMLTPSAVRAIEGVDEATLDRLASRLLGHFIDESEFAVTNPDLLTRTQKELGTQRGTPEGEFLRSLFLFKSFPVAMINRHVRRAIELQRETGQGLAYGASLMVTLTAFGALSLQAKDLVAGKDPRPMDNGKFWAASFVQGGGLGIYTDLLYTGMGGQNRGGAPNWASIAGPVFGTAFDAIDVTLGNLGQELQGKDSKFGAELMRFTRSNLPLVNLWYARGAIDHSFFHAAQDSMSPGYLSRMRQRARRDWGQDYWWDPGTGLPDRAPDFSNAVGQ